MFNSNQRIISTSLPISLSGCATHRKPGCSWLLQYVPWITAVSLPPQQPYGYHLYILHGAKLDPCWWAKIYSSWISVKSRDAPMPKLVSMTMPIWKSTHALPKRSDTSSDTKTASQRQTIF